MKPQPTNALAGLVLLFQLFLNCSALATPANKTALAKYYDRYLKQDLNQCATCHLPKQFERTPETLDEFPHNPFGHRLRLLGEALRAEGKKADLPTRLALVAAEDADGDGVSNEMELLLGRRPGDAADKPQPTELEAGAIKRDEFTKFLGSYRWKPFEAVQRPVVPIVRNQAWVRNPIDAFLAAEHETRNLSPRPEAPKTVLLRRVYLDLIGLSPTADEVRAFEADSSTGAYERIVERLLSDPRYGERWGRHWMDVWRYSDWAGWSGGNQIRDSQPHVWRWRDWIVDSLNTNKGYDQMIEEMLAADELAPEDPDALRATGYLVRNYKMLSREQWLEDTVKHTAQAFLGITMGCAKCHNHMFDPISQKEYYQFRAVFEPHEVRIDRLPGELDTAKKGVVHAFDAKPNAKTFLFHRGDERNPDTNQVLAASPPAILGGSFKVHLVALPRLAAAPDKREFVIRDFLVAADQKVAQMQKDVAAQQAKVDAALSRQATGPSSTVARSDQNKDDPKESASERQAGVGEIQVSKDEAKLTELKSKLAVSEAERASLLATLRAERLEDTGKKETDSWKDAATEASSAQRRLASTQAKLDLLLARQNVTDAEAKLETATKAPEKKGQEKATKDLEAAKKKMTDAEKKLADADKELQAPQTTAYKPRPMQTYPGESTGRRLALARWIADAKNPLTARVAVNHVWLRHFGQAIVPTVADFGYGGRPPTHPQLLDWLAAEFTARNWRMKDLHRLIVTSSAYRMASTTDDANATIDPDNHYLWRVNSRRMEAEVVRDNVLYLSGQLDPEMGGPEIDHNQGLTSRRRSLYLRIAAEKEVEFLKIFDGPSVTECYERRESVMPQQALALANSELVLKQARKLAGLLSQANANASSASGESSQPTARGPDAEFIERAFENVLARSPTTAERKLCLEFLAKGSKDSRSAPERARQNLVLVLFNHNDFVTIR